MRSRAGTLTDVLVAGIIRFTRCSHEFISLHGRYTGVVATAHSLDLISSITSSTRIISCMALPPLVRSSIHHSMYASYTLHLPLPIPTLSLHSSPNPPHTASFFSLLLLASSPYTASWPALHITRRRFACKFCRCVTYTEAWAKKKSCEALGFSMARPPDII